MNNLGYLTASMVLIWVLLVGYLAFIHSTISELQERLDRLEED